VNKLIISTVIFFIVSFGVLSLDFDYHYQSNSGKYISLAPSLTEIVYEIGAQDNLIAVSTCCNHPEQAQEKIKVGGLFYTSEEEILKLKPERIFALIDQKPIIDRLKFFTSDVHYYDFRTFEDIYNCINSIGKLTGHEDEAQNLVKKMKARIDTMKTSESKDIIYIIQVEPVITAGKRSFISDLIEKSGHNNVVAEINDSYPEVSLEYIISKKPDIIVLQNKYYADYLKQFINTEYILLSPELAEISGRPGPRIYEALEFFASL
jgi:iron complex transport system substrate-binding protein